MTVNLPVSALAFVVPALALQDPLALKILSGDFKEGDTIRRGRAGFLGGGSHQ